MNKVQLKNFTNIPFGIEYNNNVVERRFIADGMNVFERNVKRAGDCLLAIIGLIVFSPLFVVCYFLVKREDNGPAIFKQERIGRFGKPFYIYKFRSMKVDAEKDGPQLFKHNQETRLTHIGAFLRRHHLDELPQLWNVVKGDMALSVLVLNVNSISTRLWSMILDIFICIRFVQE